ncbi:MAG: RusA family crossover junction endodeoxyribonuclease [Synergistaceae bacterium]|nr:RusA family crossover junction endodeoxyribonuclease [Synergistaceae bacterium]
MKKLITLELEGLPPTINHLYRTFRNRRYKTAKAQAYQETVSGKLRCKWESKPPYLEPIELRITFITKDKRRWDIDNRVKALQDCLSMAGIIKDDKQVNILHVERHAGKKTATYIDVYRSGEE